MLAKKTLIAVATLIFLGSISFEAGAFDITGGKVWQDRVGPGVSFSLGLNGCLRDFCDDVWDTGASIGSSMGFLYRIIPNVVVFADIQMGHLPIDYDFVDQIDKDNGFVFQATGGAEFHLPLTGWLAPYAGFGMGYAYLGMWGEFDIQDNPEFHQSFRGLDFQIRMGADFFPFSGLSSLSVGPVLFWSLPYWITLCSENDLTDDECDEPDDMVTNKYDDDLPFILYFGIAGKYVF